MEKIQYTGLNYEEVKTFTCGKVMAPYECMGFSMLSLLQEDGTAVTINEGDWIIKDESGHITIE